MKKNFKSKIYFSLVIVIVIVSISNQSYIKANDEENNEEDSFEEIGEITSSVAIGLFIASAFYVLIYLVYKYSNNLSDEKWGSKKKFIKKNFQKYRKYLVYFHYITGILGVLVLLLHGISLTEENELTGAIGWVTGAIYLLYLITGLFLWVKIPYLWRRKKLRRIVNKVHRNLLLFGGIFLIHLIHLILAD